MNNLLLLTMTNLSILQRRYMKGLKLDVGNTHKYNIIAAIRKKLTDFDYFLVEFLEYSNTEKFNNNILSIKKRIDEYVQTITFKNATKITVDESEYPEVKGIDYPINELE